VSEERKSIPPVPPMSGDKLAAAKVTKPIAPAKVTKPLSAAKVNAKVAKPAIPESRKNAKGEALRCMVMLNATKQCANPMRHAHGKAWTCSTHDRAIRAGRKVTLRGKATLVYVAPHAVASAT